MKKTIFTLLFAAVASLMFAAEPYFRAAWMTDSLKQVFYPTYVPAPRK